MKVIIEEAMVDDAFACGMDVALSQLLAHAFSGRDAFCFRSDAALEKCLSLYSEEKRERFAKALDAAILQGTKNYANPLTILVQAIPTSKWDETVPKLTLPDAVALLNERFAILLEDEANDWAFLKGILEPEERALLSEYEQARWLEVLHGGGTKLLPILKKRLRSPHLALRTFVMFDSDRMHEDELAPDWQPQVGKNDCHALKYEAALNEKYPHHYWRVERRFIESYMPLPELENWATAKGKENAFQSFACLSEQQRWYYNMKSGFAGDNSTAKIRQKGLYAGVTGVQRSHLEKGFDKHLANHYATANQDAPWAWDQAALAERDSIVPNLLRLL
jgi:hypothetical protein